VQVKLWGTRGSLPQAMTQDTLLLRVDQLASAAKAAGCTTIDDMTAAMKSGKLGPVLQLGGNTTCSEVSHGSNHIFVDCGTGITDACYAAMAAGRKEFHILQTHMHWDHIMGLPFFIPIYIPGFKLTIYHVHSSAPEYMKILFNGINFPVKWADLSAQIEFKHLKLYDSVHFGDISVRPFVLDHPGGSFGYRFDCNGKSVAIGVDGEYKRLTPQELGKDLPFYQNLDMLIFDGQYEMDELASRFDWGHSSPPIGVDLAMREGIKNLVLTHHDPRSGPEKALKMLENARKHAAAQLPTFKDLWSSRGQPNGPKIHSAFDGMTLDLEKI
jgi:phosphoribosyl 1,2-cyclic phosphodiesterase